MPSNIMLVIHCVVVSIAIIAYFSWTQLVIDAINSLGDMLIDSLLFVFQCSRHLYEYLLIMPQYFFDILMIMFEISMEVLGIDFFP
ncbi:hypothetical protein JTB14_032908 [Gonioctena quinquepunctata]|nr:hypothetical protein JTB14_032908 [Gonioctena quinquepunctata]